MQFQVSNSGFHQDHPTLQRSLLSKSSIIPSASNMAEIMWAKTQCSVLSTLSVSHQSYLTRPEPESMSLYWLLTWRWWGCCWWWWSDDMGWGETRGTQRRECSLLKWDICDNWIHKGICLERQNNKLSFYFCDKCPILKCCLVNTLHSSPRD